MLFSGALWKWWWRERWPSWHRTEASRRWWKQSGLPSSARRLSRAPSKSECEAVQFSSVQFKTTSIGKAHMRSPPHLSGVSPMLPLKQFQCWSDWRWPFLILSRKIVEHFLFLRMASCARLLSYCCSLLWFVWFAWQYNTPTAINNEWTNSTWRLVSAVLSQKGSN